MTTYSTVTPTIDNDKTDLSERHVAYFGTLAFSANAYKTGGSP